MTKYARDYFENGVDAGISCYKDYRWLPELTIPLAHEIVTQLRIGKSERILDFGCAKGYLVKALRLLHYDAWGVDVSEYALSQAPDDVRPYLAPSIDKLGVVEVDKFSWVISKDVLEHLEPAQIAAELRTWWRITRRAFVVVPLGDGVKYVVPAYEKDVTHVVRQPLAWWCKVFERAGFDVEQARYRMPHVKENWAHYPTGNGFFVLRKK